MGLLNFLFGKQAKIFNDKGEVQHDIGKERWDAWNNRYKNDPTYNWKNHTGTQAKASQNKKPY